MALKREIQYRDVHFGIQGIDSVEKQLGSLRKIAREQLQDAKNTLQVMQKGTTEYDAQVKKIGLLEKEMDRLATNANKLVKVLANPAEASGKEFKQSMNAYSQGIERVKLQMNELGNASSQSMEVLREMVRTQRYLKAEYEASKVGIKDLTAELDKQKMSYSDLNSVIKIYEQYGRDLSYGYVGKQKEAFAIMGKNATIAKEEVAKLDGTIVKISNDTKTVSLENMAKFYKDMMSYAGASAKQVEDFGVKYDQTMRALAERYQSGVGLAWTGFLPKEKVEGAVRWLEKYRDKAVLSTEEQNKLNKSILIGQNYLKQLQENSTYGKGSAMWEKMSAQFGRFTTISKEALTEQQKYWQAVQERAQASSNEYVIAEARLKHINEELERRKTLETRSQGLSITEQVNAGTFKGTIQETQQAIEKLKEYRATLHAGDGDDTKIKAVDAAISTLSGNLAKVREDVMAGKAALEQFGNETGRVSALEKEGAEGLAKMRANLEAYKKSLKGTGAVEQLKRVEAMITDVDRAQKNLNADAIEWSKFKGGELQKRSLTELRAAYDALKKQIEAMSPAQQGYNEKAMQMRMIDKQVKELNKSIGHHVSSLQNAASRLKNYVMIYLGFNAIMSKIRALTGDIMKLGDAMTNVEKVTNMSANEVARLADSLQKIDTRTPTAKLMEYAEQAGKLGIYTKGGLEGMIQFVEMGDRIGRTLGEDIGGAQAVADLAKINDIMKVTERAMKRTGDEATVMRDALNATGSAILNVGNNSAASYGPVVEYVSRLGAISSTSNIAMEETIALGATLDALKMPAEAGSTALQQFIAAVRRNADGMAQAAGLSVKTVRELMDTGQTFKALQMIFTQVNNGVATSQDLMNAMTGRQRSNANMRNVIELLSGNLDLLNKELGYAKEGFESAFGDRTSGDIQLVLEALRRLGRNGSMNEIINLFKLVRDGKITFRELSEQLAGTTFDIDVMRTAVENAYTTMETLSNEGRLTSETMEAIATSTSSLSVMEKEFERVNDSAAAHFEKFSKMMHDTFVNSAFVEFFANVGKGLMNFIEWLNSGEKSARVFGTAVVAVTTYVVLLKTRLKELIFVDLVSKLKLFATSLVNLGVKILGVITSWNKLKAALSANWLGLIATAIAGLVYWIQSANDETAKFAKAAAEAANKLHEEQREAALLFAQLKNLNLTTDERRRLIDQINSKYGKLIGYMIDENTKGKALANTYELINAKLREKARLQLRENLYNTAKGAGDEKYQKGVEGLSKMLEDMYGNNAYGKAYEYLAKIQAALEREIAKNPNRDSEDIANAAIKAAGGIDYKFLKEQYDKESWGYKFVHTSPSDMRYQNATNFALLAKVKSMADGMKQSSTAMSRVAAVMQGGETFDIEQSTKAYIDRINIVNKNVKATLEKFKSSPASLTDKELTNALREMNSVLNDKSYANAVKKDSNEEKILQSFRWYAREMTKENKNRNSKTPWGDMSTEGKEMKKWTTKALQAYIQELEKARSVATDDTKWEETFPNLTMVSSGMKRDDADAALDEEIHKVREILESRHQGVNSPHHPKDREDKQKKEEQEMKQEMEASLAKLEEYYERRQMMAEKALNEGVIGEDEYNRYLFANEQEHLMERQNLRNKWLDSDHKFMTKGVEELMSGVDFGKLSKFLTSKGKAMVDGIKLNIAKDENEFEKNIRENREKIEKILLDERPIAKIAKTFVSDLAELRVLWNDGTEAVLKDSEAAQKEMIEKMSFLMNEAKKGYALTSKELIEDMVASGNPLLIEWAKQLTKEDNKAALNAIVLKTQGFFDEYEDAVKKMITKVNKRIEYEWKKIGPDGKSIEQSFADATKAIEKQQQSQAMADSWGLTGYNLAGVGDKDKLEIAMLEKKVELEKERYDLIVQRMREEHQAILDNAEASKKMAEDARKRAEELKKMKERDPERQKELLDNQRIAAEKEKEAALLFQEAEAMKEASVRATTEAFENLKAAQEEATQGHLNLLSNAVEQVKPYYDNLMSFAENFGENIFGSKADRKQAAKELLASVIETTGKMLTQWLVYISTKKMYDQMEIMQEAVKQKVLLALTLEAKAAELKAQGNFEQAETTLGEAASARDAALAQSKEAAKAGWIGWAIGAGLSLLMTTVFKGISSKVRQTIAETTGVSGSSGKLATGMLTYANGRYPTYSDGTMSVQGNDGNTYNATYKPNLSTGEYRTPHLGIVGEKGAELIVDSPTYKSLQRYRPDILDDIYRIHRYGTRRVDWGETARRGNEVLARRAGVRTFADGNIDEVLDGAAMADNTASQEALITTLSSLAKVLANIQQQGIAAHMSVYGSQGARSQLDKANRFMRKVGR